MSPFLGVLFLIPPLKVGPKFLKTFARMLSYKLGGQEELRNFNQVAEKLEKLIEYAFIRQLYLNVQFLIVYLEITWIGLMKVSILWFMDPLLRTVSGDRKIDFTDSIKVLVDLLFWSGSSKKQPDLVSRRNNSGY